MTLELAEVSSAPVLTVAKRGDRDAESISDAIERAAPGTRIIVRPGTYRESLVLCKEVEVIADGAVTIISEGSPCILMQTDYAKVHGLTLRCHDNGGSAAVEIPLGLLELAYCDISSYAAPCLDIRGFTAEPNVHHCAMRGGTVGVLIRENARAVIEFCSIEGQTLAGIEIASKGDPIIRSCEIKHGCGRGVFVHHEGMVRLETCDIYGHRLANVEFATGGHPDLRNCRIHGGNAEGILFSQFSTGSLSNCQIYGNAGAGVSIQGSGRPALRGCDIFGGAAQGVLIHNSGQATLENCQIDFTSLAGIEVREHAHVTLQRCIVQGSHERGIHIYSGAAVKMNECRTINNAREGVLVERGGNCTIDGGQHEKLVKKDRQAFLIKILKYLLIAGTIVLFFKTLLKVVPMVIGFGVLVLFFIGMVSMIVNIIKLLINAISKPFRRNRTPNQSPGCIRMLQ